MQIKFIKNLTQKLKLKSRHVYLSKIWFILSIIFFFFIIYRDGIYIASYHQQRFINFLNFFIHDHVKINHIVVYYFGSDFFHRWSRRSSMQSFSRASKFLFYFFLFIFFHLKEFLFHYFQLFFFFSFFQCGYHTDCCIPFKCVNSRPGFKACATVSIA